MVRAIPGAKVIALADIAACLYFDELRPDGGIWQGNFPSHNSGRDGWLATAPARSFAANGYGLYNIVGNVWQWTADAYSLPKHRSQQHLEALRACKVLKGGSFLCHRSYCHRYRIAARSASTPDSTTTHQGYRIAWDA